MSWLENENRLEQEFKFKDFKTALEFVNKVGLIAEKIGHHPEIYLTWGYVKITTTTHDKGNIITKKDLQLIHGIDGIT